MFCPKCKSEYREGFTKCSDCGVTLIDELPREKEHQKIKVEYADFECILATLKYTDIAEIKSIFECGNITYFIQGEDMGVSPGGMAARVLVKIEQVEEAKELLKEIGIM